MSVKFTGKPIFLSLADLKLIGIAKFKKDPIKATPKPIRDYLSSLNEVQPFVLEEYEMCMYFLLSKGLKTEATYRLFRSDLERFLIWAWHVKESSVTRLKRRDLEEYFDFVRKPSEHWISDIVYSRFDVTKVLNDDGRLMDLKVKFNGNWRPFSIRTTKNDPRAREKIKNYHADWTFIKASMSALNVFFEYLVSSDYAFGNVVPAVKRDSPYFVKDVSYKEVKRFSELQWDYLLHTCKEYADRKPKYERSLFIVVCMRSLYLRISELSALDYFTPIMSNFFTGKDGDIWLKVMGKGKKIRNVSIPDAFLPFLARYRNYMGLSDFPEKDDKRPILPKFKGSGALSSRQIRDIVKEMFKLTYDEMVKDGFVEEAQAFITATPHCLRHTGASMDIDGRPIKHISDDLGHASITTTDNLYVQSDYAERAHSGKGRNV